MGLGRRDEGPALGHQDDEGGLPQEGALTGHVGTGEDDNLLFFAVQIHVVGDIFLSRRHQRFDDRMPAFPDVQRLAAVHVRPTVMALHGLLGKPGEHVHLREDAAVALDVGNLLPDAADELSVKAGLDGIDAVFGRENLLFVLLELFGDVAFRVHQGLLPDPFRGHLVPVGVAHLDIVAENVVVGDFERGDSGAFGLPLLHLQEVVLAAGAHPAQFVQLGVHPFGDYRPLANLDGRFRVHDPHDFLQQPVAVAEAFQQFGEGLGSLQPFLDGPGDGQAAGKLHHLARESLSVGDAAQDALHVPDFSQIQLRLLQDFGLFGKVLYDIVPGIQFLEVQDGHGQPAAEHAGAHGAGTLVQRLHQRDAALSGCALEHLQVAQGETVHPYELGLVDAADAADVPEPGVLRLFQIHQQGPGAADSQGIRVDGKALEAVHLKLAPEALHGGIVHERPFVDGCGVEVSETLFQPLLVPPLNHQFLGLERAQQRADVIQRPLRHLELSGGHVQESGPAAVLFHGEPAEVVVLLLFQHPLTEGNARRNNFRYTAFDQFLGEFGVFQLVADGHFVTGPDQFGEITFYGVVREAGHGDGPLVSVGFLGEHQTQHPGGRHGVVRVTFIKVSHPVKQQGFRVLRLHLEKLFDEGGVFRNLCHNSRIIYKDSKKFMTADWKGRPPQCPRGPGSESGNIPGGRCGGCGCRRS